VSRREIKKAQKIVFKLGTRLLTYANGKLNLDYMERIVRELANLKNQGKDAIIVSSGAIGAGIGRLNLNYRPKATPEKQAVAAVGQGVLIQFYEKFFAEYGQIVAQILLTREDLVNRRRYVNACNTLQTLLKFGVIPIINENDTISVDEIEFGDNDTLSALVAGLVDSDLLVILSDIDGFYTADPQKQSQAKLIPVVETITAELKEMAKGTDDALATGGMVTKLQAAEITMSCGVNCVIANGLEPGIINRIVRGEEIGTLFKAQKNYLRARKRWIAFGQLVHGAVIVDDGARKALIKEGKSLLASGITAVNADFCRGDLVAVCDQQGNEFARGLSNYSSVELQKIKGLQSEQIAAVLGEQDVREEVIHRDNLVIY
jgi:glutamate 5-kinase